MDYFVSENYDYNKIELKLEKHELFRKFNVQLENVKVVEWIKNKSILLIILSAFLYLIKLRSLKIIY